MSSCLFISDCPVDSVFFSNSIPSRMILCKDNLVTMVELSQLTGETFSYEQFLVTDITTVFDYSDPLNYESIVGVVVPEDTIDMIVSTHSVHLHFFFNFRFVFKTTLCTLIPCFLLCA